MTVSRRQFLRAAGAGAVAMPLASAQASHSSDSVSREQILKLFEDLPGDKSIKVLIPEAPGTREFSVQLNANRTLFVASAIKTYVLCEALRQADSPNIDQVLEDKKLALVGSPGTELEFAL